MGAKAGQEYFVLKYICTYVLVLKYIAKVLRFPSTFRVHVSTLGYYMALFSEYKNG